MIRQFIVILLFLNSISFSQNVIDSLFCNIPVNSGNEDSIMDYVKGKPKIFGLEESYIRQTYIWNPFCEYGHLADMIPRGPFQATITGKSVIESEPLRLVFELGKSGSTYIVDSVVDTLRSYWSLNSSIIYYFEGRKGKKVSRSTYNKILELIPVQWKETESGEGSPKSLPDPDEATVVKRYRRFKRFFNPENNNDLLVQYNERSQEDYWVEITYIKKLKYRPCKILMRQ